MEHSHEILAPVYIGRITKIRLFEMFLLMYQKTMNAYNIN